MAHTILHLWNYIFRKSTVYSLLICAIMIYIYLGMFMYPETTISLPVDSDENLIEIPKNSVSQDRIQMILSLKRQIMTINKKQRIQNVNSFGPEISLVIVIQVHDKTYYLEHLMDSLKQATGISKTLLIFSHSYCDEVINSLVRNTSFAQVMQIFYPYTVQLHPSEFPGNDHKICDDLINCYEGNRNPLLMQPKHHWWWKAAYVFDELRILKDYNASVLFLEEDQYVTQDFLYIVKVLERIVSVNYPNRAIITLGGNNRIVSTYNVRHGTVTFKPWGPSDYIGVVFNRNVWNTMRSLSEHFCRYNDSRWINSLINLGRKSTTTGFLATSIDSARVFRFSECPRNRTSCHIVEKVELVEGFVKRITSGLYPQTIMIRETNEQENLVPDGKWYDARDQELCLYYSNSYLKELNEGDK